MQKWIIATLFSIIVQNTTFGTLIASQHEESLQAGLNLHNELSCHDKSCNKQGPAGPVGNPGTPGGGFELFASYWLTNQPSLTEGQNVLFNLQQALSGIDYDPSTGIFTVPAGVYAINFFGTPNLAFQNTLNLNVNGTIIPTPSLEGSMVVLQFLEDNNQISVQATGNWSPQISDLGSYFFAYASIAIYQIGS